MPGSMINWGGEWFVHADAACKHRIFTGTKDLRLIALDARSGKLCNDFGVNGTVNIRPDIYDDVPNLEEGDVQFSAPPIAINDIVQAANHVVAAINRTRVGVVAIGRIVHAARETIAAVDRACIDVVAVGGIVHTTRRWVTGI